MFLQPGFIEGLHLAGEMANLIPREPSIASLHCYISIPTVDGLGEQPRASRTSARRPNHGLTQGRASKHAAFSTRRKGLGGLGASRGTAKSAGSLPVVLGSQAKVFVDALALIFPVDIDLVLEKIVKVFANAGKTVGNHGLAPTLLNAPEVFLIVGIEGLFLWGRCPGGSSLSFKGLEVLENLVWGDARGSNGMVPGRYVNRLAKRAHQ